MLVRVKGYVSYGRVVEERRVGDESRIFTTFCQWNQKSLRFETRGRILTARLDPQGPVIEAASDSFLPSQTTTI